MSDESHLVDPIYSEPYEPEDSDPFNFDNEDMVGCLLSRLRRVAINLCPNVQAAEELVGEAMVRLNREKPWLRPTCSTYGAVVAFATVVSKNIRNKDYSKQKRRDALRVEVEAKFGKPSNEFAETEDRMYLEEVINVLKRVPPFARNEKARRLIQYEFVEKLTHEEIASALGKTPRQLTKFKMRIYPAIPTEVLVRLFGKIRTKK
jgi:RNA polymerase sigma factor (sigma-70 family)